MTEPQAIVARAFALMNRIAFLDRRNHVQDETGTRLFSSEIHAMLAIAQDPTTNATQLADRLGVTKGAVSQTLTRLQKKDVIKTEKIPQTKNEIRVLFTPKGHRILEQTLEWVNERHARLDAFLASLSDSDRQAIDRFLEAIEAVIG